MAEERQQAYLELVQQLLNCESGNEPEILAAHGELVDEGLVAMALDLARMLAEREESDTAESIKWLQGFAHNLAQVLGLSSGDRKPQTQLKFLLTVLQAVSDSDGDSQVVYPLLGKNLGLLDELLIGVLQGWAEQTFAESEPKRVRSIAICVSNLGNLLQDFPLGNKAINIDLAITCYELLAEVFTINADPGIWATIQNNCANAYSDRINGDRADNLELAIEGYNSSLQVYAQEDSPIDWAMSQHNLSLAYSNRINGNRADNLELAIAGYESCLEIYTQEDFPIDWAMTQNNLSNAYLNRIDGSRADNLERAIAGYESCLKVRTRGKFPIQWATTQNNLANAYSDRVNGDKAENLELAIAGYELCLEVYNKEEFPIQWATTQNNLANAYSKRINDDRANDLELAIAGYGSSLQVYSQEDFPIQWAMTQNNLSLVYSNRIKGNRADNLELAIAGYESCLEVRTRKDFPIQWAMTQNNLAAAYTDRIKGDRADNLELAITGYESCLEIYTRENFSIDWAMTQNNRANAYSRRIKGDRADNLELAITGYESCLEIYTREDFPIDWAMAQNNLATAYSDRIKGDRADNLELAITSYELCLEVRNRKDFPIDWAMTQNNLATAYSDRIEGNRADNLELAISGYESCLEVRNRKDFPIQWATTQNNLATVYSDRIEGNRADNLESAITGFNASLQVYNRKDFPIQWATTQNNRATAYRDRIKGERAKNLEEAIAGYKAALKVYTREAFSRECRITSRSLGNIHFDQQDWAAATNAYDNALAAAEILYQSCILLDSKTSELAENADLCHRMTYALAQTGDLTKAIETIERSRARSLTESLDRDRADLDRLQQHNPALYNQYKELNQKLRNLEAQQRDRMTSDTRHEITPEALRNSATTLRQNLDELVQAIRQVPGYEEFLALPTFAEIQNAVQPDRPLVYLITTSAGGLALILQPEKIEPVWLNDFTSDQITTLLQTWFHDSQQFQQNRQAWYDTINSVTRQLWAPLMAPIIQKLQEMQCDRATLIPTGHLSFFPLHAAWTASTDTPTGRLYAQDRIHFTYAPNAKSLTAATAIAKRTATNSILAIDNPRQDLPNSEREVNAALDRFPQSTVLKQAEATVEKVRSHLMTAETVHFSCHGYADLQNPLNSGLRMSDGLLTLRDVFALNLAERGGIRLAVLSACETGLSGLENADEAISLPTGLLQAGVAGVAASLWSVSDLSTMLLLTRFYNFWRIEDLEISLALDRAQQWVRDTTNIQKYNYLKDTFQKLAAAQRVPEQEVNDLLRDFMLHYIYPDGPQGQSFAHPFHWAAFSYVGV